MDKQTLLKQFSTPDERLSFSKVLDRIFFCANKYEATFTDFLDPAKTEAFTRALGDARRYDVNMCVFGGFPGAERQMFGFCPDYETITPRDFPVAAVRITHNAKFGKELTHRDYLGSIIGLGVDRGKLGDILVGTPDANSAIVYAHSDIAGFICSGLERVGRTSVSVDMAEMDVCGTDVGGYGFGDGADGLGMDGLGSDGSFVIPNMQINVTSFRLDVFVSEAFNLSRREAADVIEGSKVFVNWSACANKSASVKPGDVITVRGYGRVTIVELCGKTKKDRFIVNVKKDA